MATKWYTKETQYTLPAWNPVAIFLDGLYIDGDLFHNNIPVQDMVVWISVQPDNWHIVAHEVIFNIATFNKSTGTVGFLDKKFQWGIGQGHAQSDKIFCNGNPYGMGVNMFSGGCIITFGTPIANPIIYYTHFIMEVTV